MSTTDQRPALLLSRIDVERIEDLLERPEYRSLDTTALRGELERAELVEPGAMPGDVITMNTTALVRQIRGRYAGVAAPPDPLRPLRRISIRSLQPLRPAHHGRPDQQPCARECGKGGHGYKADTAH